MRLGFHASHEQFAPSELLRLAGMARDAGFDALHSSDHFHPWSCSQGQSGQAWSWLGAAMAATGLPAGLVNAPGQRYHPAIVAQMAATLAEMFPGKFWIALGTGQLLNEGVDGGNWPPKSIRQARLLECAEIIRTLWAGETVTHHGLVHVEEARLYSLPARPPPLLGAAVSAATAGWVAQWADGLITVSQPREKLQEVVEAFRRGGGRGKPIILKVQLSYAGSYEAALEGAYQQWRAPILDSSVQAMLRTPDQFDAAVQFIPHSAVEEHVRISADLDRHVAWLIEDLEMGFQSLYLHNVNREQQRFIEDFGNVLPALRRHGGGP